MSPAHTSGILLTCLALLLNVQAGAAVVGLPETDLLGPLRSLPIPRSRGLS